MRAKHDAITKQTGKISFLWDHQQTQTYVTGTSSGQCVGSDIVRTAAKNTVATGEPHGPWPCVANNTGLGIE